MVTKYMTRTDNSRFRIRINKVKLVTIMLLMTLTIAVLMIPITPAVGDFKLNVSMYPVEGDTSTNVNLFISIEPVVSLGSWKLYVYWEGDVIVNGITDTRIGKTDEYKHLWVVPFNPPYGKKGDTYIVRVVVLSNMGKIYEKYSTFKMRATVPQLSWFDELTDEEIESIRGIQGKDGVSGLQGSRGDVGRQGVVGEQGELGAQGVPGLQGEVGIPGPIGLQGDTGASAPIWIVYIALILSVINTLAVIVILSTRGD